MELEEKQKVTVSKIGTDGHMSIVGLFQVIQDAVSDLLCLHDLSAPALKSKYNAIWLFVKTRAKFLSKLSCQDVYTTHTYFSYVSLAKMYVDVKIEDARGQTVMYSRTVLCALDIEKQTIRRLPTVGVDIAMPTRSDVVDLQFADLPETDLPSIGTVKVNMTNLDMSHHTNNTEYVRMIMSTYSVAEAEAMKIKDMELIYKGQSFENDELNIRKAVVGNRHSIVLEKGGSTVIYCEIICE